MNQLVGDDALVRIEGITGATNIRRQIGVSRGSRFALTAKAHGGIGQVGLQTRMSGLLRESLLSRDGKPDSSRWRQCGVNTRTADPQRPLTKDVPRSRAGRWRHPNPLTDPLCRAALEHDPPRVEHIERPRDVMGFIDVNFSHIRILGSPDADSSRRGDDFRACRHRCSVHISGFVAQIGDLQITVRQSGEPIAAKADEDGTRVGQCPKQLASVHDESL
jgi:hypothetical protein